MKEPDKPPPCTSSRSTNPRPFLLVNKGSLWYFDTEAGKKEIVYRRIGENEISTIRVMPELVAAEKEYSSTQIHNGMPPKSFRMKASTMAPLESRGGRTPVPPSGRSWRQPLPRDMSKTKMALRLRTAVTITAF